jgi:hypothetical protein
VGIEAKETMKKLTIDDWKCAVDASLPIGPESGIKGVTWGSRQIVNRQWSIVNPLGFLPE